MNAIKKIHHYFFIAWLLICINFHPQIYTNSIKFSLEFQPWDSHVYIHNLTHANLHSCSHNSATFLPIFQPSTRAYVATNLQPLAYIMWPQLSALKLYYVTITFSYQILLCNHNFHEFSSLRTTTKFTYFSLHFQPPKSPYETTKICPSSATFLLSKFSLQI